MCDAKYVDTETARQTLGICAQTLRKWANQGKIDYIRTEEGWRKYNLEKYLRQNKLLPKKKVCYARVSSYDQKDDLATQMQHLIRLYPSYEIVKDIGSGILNAKVLCTL